MYACASARGLPRVPIFIVLVAVAAWHTTTRAVRRTAKGRTALLWAGHGGVGEGLGRLRSEEGPAAAIEGCRAGRRAGETEPRLLREPGTAEASHCVPHAI
jgi:hypothetical protein